MPVTYYLAGIVIFVAYNQLYMRFNVISLLATGILCIAAAGCSNSDTKTDKEVISYSIAEEHVKVWDVAIDQVVELIDSMPSEHLNFSPDDTIRTFAEQIVHIGISSQLITNLFLKDIPRPENIEEVNAAEMTKEELKAFAREHLGKVRETIASMSDEELLNEKVTSYMNHKMTRLEGMIFAHDHLTNHKAKANLYIRLVGARPPHYAYY